MLRRMQTPAANAIAAAEQLLRAGQWARARALAAPHVGERALAVRARAVLANAAMQLGDHAEAAAQFRWLQSALPAHAGIRAALSLALNNLGSAALQAGDTAGAEAHYREALAADERNALACFNLAARAQARNDFELAARGFARATALDPARSEARLKWAICERVRGAPDAARTALAGFEGQPLTPEVAAAVGAEWDLLGEPARAAQIWARALPQADAALLLRIARAQAGSGDAGAARATAAQAAGRSGGDGSLLSTALLAALVLPVVPADAGEIRIARAEFAAGIERLERDWPAERLRSSAATLDDLAHSHYALAYHGEDDFALANAFGNWYSTAAQALAPAGSFRDPVARRVALVSARWSLGTIGAYFGPWIGALRNAGWEVELVHLGSTLDATTHALAAQASRFHHLEGPLGSVVSVLRERAPALILYPEIGLSPRVHPLAALRLAPVQAAAWGHPVTSGLPTIDHWLSCDCMEPPDGARHYRERLNLLPGLGTCYARPARAPSMTLAELGLPPDRTIYLAPHSPVKLHPDFDALLARVAAGDRQASIVMFEDGAPALSARLQTRLRHCFEAHGVDPGKHLVWLPRATPERFRAVLRASHVLLDTPGFSGGNTSLDAIAQSLPLVTLPGGQMRSRQSAAMLRHCGVAELVAGSVEEYVALAVRAGHDSAWRRTLGDKLDHGAGTLFDDSAALAALSRTLDAWSA
jgi:predicted O-linked N-acetylglucosamine transferase (SPINDLY family)